MLKFNKVLNSKIVSLTIACVFLLTNITYGIDLSGKSTLRKPLDFNGSDATSRYLSALSLTTSNFVPPNEHYGYVRKRDYKASVEGEELAVLERVREDTIKSGRAASITVFGKSISIYFDQEIDNTFIDPNLIKLVLLEFMFRHKIAASNLPSELVFTKLDYSRMLFEGKSSIGINAHVFDFCSRLAATGNADYAKAFMRMGIFQRLSQVFLKGEEALDEKSMQRQYASKLVEWLGYDGACKLTDLLIEERILPQNAFFVRLVRHQKYWIDKEATSMSIKKLNFTTPGIGRNAAEFKHLYQDTEEVFKRILVAAGLDPDIYDVYLLDTTNKLRIFVHPNDYRVFVSLGCIKMLIDNKLPLDALAFFLAHEVRHIVQCRDNIDNGRGRIDISKIYTQDQAREGVYKMYAERFVLEKEADPIALDYVEAAGYSVKWASEELRALRRNIRRDDFVEELIQKVDPHEAINQRIIYVDKHCRQRYWANFNNRSEFSAAAQNEAKNPSQLRAYQTKIVHFDFDRDYFGKDIKLSRKVIREVIGELTMPRVKFNYWNYSHSDVQEMSGVYQDAYDEIVNIMRSARSMEELSCAYAKALHFREAVRGSPEAERMSEFFDSEKEGKGLLSIYNECAENLLGDKSGSATAKLRVQELFFLPIAMYCEDTHAGARNTIKFLSRYEDMDKLLDRLFPQGYHVYDLIELLKVGFPKMTGLDPKALYPKEQEKYFKEFIGESLKFYGNFLRIIYDKIMKEYADILSAEELVYLYNLIGQLDMETNGGALLYVHNIVDKLFEKIENGVDVNKDMMKRIFYEYDDTNINHIIILLKRGYLTVDDLRKRMILYDSVFTADSGGRIGSGIGVHSNEDAQRSLMGAYGRGEWGTFGCFQKPNEQLCFRFFDALGLKDPVQLLQFLFDMFHHPNVAEHVRMVTKYFNLGPKDEIALIKYALIDLMRQAEGRYKTTEDETLAKIQYERYGYKYYLEPKMRDYFYHLNYRLYRIIFHGWSTRFEDHVEDSALFPLMDKALSAVPIEGIDKLDYELKRIIYFYECGGVFFANAGSDITSLIFIDSIFSAGIHFETFPLAQRQVLYRYFQSISKREADRAFFNSSNYSRIAIRTWDEFMALLAIKLNVGNVREKSGLYYSDYKGICEKIKWHGYPYNIDSLFFANMPGDGSLDSHGTWINRWFIDKDIPPSEIARRLDDLGIPLLDAKKSFEELTTEINKMLPDGVMKNVALYILFVNRILNERYGLSIPDRSEAFFSIISMQGYIRLLPPDRQREALQYAAMIIPLLALDRSVEEMNNDIARGTIERMSVRDWRPPSDSYQAQRTEYTPAQFTNLGGYSTQMRFLLPMAFKETLEEIVSRELPSEDNQAAFNERLDLIHKLFPQKSEARDLFIERLSNAAGIGLGQLHILMEEAERENVRDVIALKALEIDRRMHPDLFKDLSYEVDRITQFYFKDFSYMRDDILNHVIQESVTMLSELKDIQRYFLAFTGNIRREEIRNKIFGRFKVLNQMIGSASSKDKKDMLLWLAGISEQRPVLIERLEYGLKVNCDFLRDEFFRVKDDGYYKGIGKSLQKELLDLILYGKNGLFENELKAFYEGKKIPLDGPAKELFDAIFENAYPLVPGMSEKDIERRNQYKQIYDILFEVSDPYRKEEVLTPLFKYFSSAQPLDANNLQAFQQREADVVGIMFSCFGLAMVKVGQVLSTSRLVDLTPEIRAKLGRLRDKANPIDKVAVFEMIDKIYGNFSARFDSLGRNLSNASVKAVYEEMSREAVREILKVKRPDCDQMIENEIAFLRDVATALSVKMHIHIPSQMMSRLEDRIRKELDFDREAKNQIRLKNAISFTLKQWEDNPFANYEFYVPIAKEVSDNFIMREEVAEGVPLTDEASIKAIGINPSEIDDLLGKLFFRMIFVCGFYHSDPHRGNIFISKMPDGKIRISIIDLGAASEISIPSRKALQRIMIGIGISDRIRVLPTMVSSHFILKGLLEIVAEPTAITKDIKREIDRIMMSKESLTSKFLDIFTELEKRDIRMSDDIVDVFNFFAAFAHLFDFVDKTSLWQLRKDSLSIEAVTWVSVDDIQPDLSRASRTDI